MNTKFILINKLLISFLTTYLFIHIFIHALVLYKIIHCIALADKDSWAPVVMDTDEGATVLVTSKSVIESLSDRNNNPDHKFVKWLLEKQIIIFKRNGETYWAMDRFSAYMRYLFES